MSDLVVSTAFTATGDQVSPLLKKQAKAAETFGSALSAAFKKVGKESSVFGAMLKANVVGSAITAGFSKIKSLAGSTIDAYMDFDTSITMAASKFPEKIKRGSAAFEMLANEARRVGKETTFSASQAAQGYDALAGAGFNVEQSIAAMTPLVQFATAANSDLATSTTVVADALGAFNFKSKDASVLAQNMTRLTDSLVFVTSTQKTTVEELSEAITAGGSAFTGAGQSMESYIALVGDLAGAGFKGSMAGTALRGGMLKIAAPTAQASAALKKMHVETKDASGNMRAFTDILSDMSVATKDMGSGEKTELLQKIFGTESIAGMVALLNMGGDKLKDYESNLRGAAGKSEEMSKEIKQTLGNRMADLGSTVEEFGFKIIKAFEKDGKDAIAQAIDSINKFDPKPIVEAVKGLIEAFKWLFGFIRDHEQTVKTLIASWVLFKATMGAISFGKQVKEIAGVVLKWQAVTVAAEEATAAQTAASAAGGAGGGVGGVAGAAGLKGFLTQDVAKAGAATNVGAVAASLSVGLAIGGFIEDEFLDPLRKAGEELELQTGNMIAKMSMQDVSAMTAQDLFKNMEDVKAQLAKEENTPAISSLEGAVSQVNSGIMGVSAAVGNFLGFFSDEQAQAIVNANQGPIDVQRAHVEQLTELYRQMALAVRQANIDIQSAANDVKTEINVNVANAPAGTTVDTKGSSGAPKVNQSQAGRS